MKQNRLDYPQTFGQAAGLLAVNFSPAFILNDPVIVRLFGSGYDIVFPETGEVLARNLSWDEVLCFVRLGFRDEELPENISSLFLSASKQYQEEREEEFAQGPDWDFLYESDRDVRLEA